MSTDELTEKQKIFLDEYFKDFPNITRETIKNAKKTAGYAEGTNIYSIIAQLSDEIIDRCKKFAALTAPEALAAQVKLMRNPVHKGGKNIIGVTNSLLDRAGLVKKEVLEVESKQPLGIIILPPKKD